MTKRTRKTPTPGMHSGAYVMPAANATRPAGGRPSPEPVMVNRREQVTPNRWITITTTWRDHAPLYRVAVVNEHNSPTTTPTPSEHRDLDHARRRANRLYARLVGGGGVPNNKENRR